MFSCKLVNIFLRRKESRKILHPHVEDVRAYGYLRPGAFYPTHLTLLNYSPQESQAFEAAEVPEELEESEDSKSSQVSEAFQLFAIAILNL
ncbi:hypothetical protein POVCU2_0048390 [Plasmodium ovale curtisi]|uniref:Uncharacterized protein n=1 Tax=Plasmodium ovale curtisi TaxID=864141 RepID=A0A1A8W625_PLAOA|nr:hypothetical protein POVCU2_0048390 [Plasmodium ovale curtisi]SBS98279.1 hypothetical protein POVCU1_044910 [Plasmodium ovale curtisi]